MFHQAMSQLCGGEVRSRDGRLGAVEDIYFDHESWQVRYVLVGTAGVLDAPRLLISSACMSSGRPARGGLKAHLSRHQLERGAGAWPIDSARHWLEGERIWSSAHVVTLRIEAQDGPAGRVADLMVDDEAWCIDYLLVDLWGGKRVLVPLDWVAGVDPAQGVVRVWRTRQELEESPVL